MTDDLHSGLPEIPEDYLWKVGEGDSGPYGSGLKSDAIGLLKFVPDGYYREFNNRMVQWWGRSAERHVVVTNGKERIWYIVPGMIEPLPVGFGLKEIREAADVVFERWVAYTKRLSLMGAYPPKRLVVD